MKIGVVAEAIFGAYCLAAPKIVLPLPRFSCHLGAVQPKNGPGMGHAPQDSEGRSNEGDRCCVSGDGGCLRKTRPQACYELSRRAYLCGMNLTFLRTDSDHPGFRSLVVLLDRELAIRDGDEHAFFAQFNKIQNIRHVVVAFLDDVPVGCGAFKEYEPGVMEVKRMFVQPDCRGRGVAGRILQGLEGWMEELGYRRWILETGEKQPEAIRLYEKSGYSRIPNYGQYVNVATSVCFEKRLGGSASSSTSI